MNSFDERFDDRLPLTHNLLRTVRLLGECRGKEELYRQQMPQALETLKQVAVIQSTESSSRIEGVTAPELGEAGVSRARPPRAMAAHIGTIRNK
jgi:hypothetical protein